MALVHSYQCPIESSRKPAATQEGAATPCALQVAVFKIATISAQVLLLVTIALSSHRRNFNHYISTAANI
jgi:hypothetical protein